MSSSSSPPPSPPVWTSSKRRFLWGSSQPVTRSNAGSAHTVYHVFGPNHVNLGFTDSWTRPPGLFPVAPCSPSVVPCRCRLDRHRRCPPPLAGAPDAPVGIPAASRWMVSAAAAAAPQPGVAPQRPPSQRSSRRQTRRGPPPAVPRWSSAPVCPSRRRPPVGVHPCRRKLLGCLCPPRVKSQRSRALAQRFQSVLRKRLLSPWHQALSLL